MKQRGIRMAVASTLLAAAAVAGAAGAAQANEGSPPDSYLDVNGFCEDVQNELAKVREGAIDFNVQYFNEDDTTSPSSAFGYRGFRSSYLKEAGVNDLSVHQMNIDQADGSVSQVMCKTKLRERLIQYPGLDKAFHGEVAQCDDVAQTIARRAQTTLDPHLRDRNPAKVVVDPTVYDQFGGLGWTPLGFKTLVTDADGTIHVRSHGLYTPSDPTTQISDAFVDMINASFGLTLPYGTTFQDIINLGALNPKVLGTHYCTLPTVSALQQAMVG